MASRVESVRSIPVIAPNSAWEAKGLNLVKDSDFFFVPFLFIHFIYEKYSSKKFRLEGF